MWAPARPTRSKAIAFKLLKWGGIIVGPFVYEGQESLIKATMRSERSFAVERLLPVAFAPLVSDGARPDTLVLRGPEWGVDSWRLFPPRFLGVAALLTWVAALPTPDDGDDAAGALDAGARAGFDAFAAGHEGLPRELWTLVLAQEVAQGRVPRSLTPSRRRWSACRAPRAASRLPGAAAVRRVQARRLLRRTRGGREHARGGRPKHWKSHAREACAQSAAARVVDERRQRVRGVSPPRKVPAPANVASPSAPPSIRARGGRSTR